MSDGNDLVLYQPTIPGLAAEVEIVQLARHHHGTIETDDYGDKTLPAALPSTVRADMQNYLRNLRVQLRPISESTEAQRRAQQAIAQILTGFTWLARDQNAEQITVSLVAYVHDLALPAIEAACEDFRRGRVTGQDVDRPPTGPRLWKVAKAYQDRFFHAHGGDVIETVLAVKKIAKPKPTPEQEAKVKAALQDLAGKIAMDFTEESERLRKRVSGEQIARDRERQEAEWKRMGIDPPKIGSVPISVGLAKQLGLKADAIERAEKRIAKETRR